MKLLARLLIIFAIICYSYGIYLIWERNNPNRLTFKNFTGNYKNVKIINPPTRIIIPDAKIDLPIFPAKIKNGVWDTVTNGASFLISSPIPGNTGNSIIYAHNWVSLFGNIVILKPGEKIEIDYQDKSKKFFTIKNTTIVPSDESSILAASKDKRLTLYTCTGWFDTKRFVVIATLNK